MHDETVSGTIIRLYSKKSGWAAGRIAVDDGYTIGFAGRVDVTEGQYVTLVGQHEEHPKYGAQFRAHDARAQLALTASGIAKQLETTKDLQGIGRITAARIAGKLVTLGDILWGGLTPKRTLELLEKYEDEIAEAATCKLQLVRDVAAWWTANMDHAGKQAALLGFGWTSLQAEKIISAGLDRTVELDPYFARSIDGFGFLTCDKVAVEGMKWRRDERLRIEAGIEHAIETEMGKGSTWVHADEIVEIVNRVLELDGIGQEELIAGMVEEQIASGALTRTQFGERALISTELGQIEMDVFAELWRRAITPYEPEAFRKVLDVVPELSDLNAEQYAAASAAFNRQLAVVTGPGGTGKSYLMRAVARAATASDMSVGMFAPTGKAAQRLEESTGYQAATIHRALYPHYKGTPIEDLDVVIVDEASMVSVDLAGMLLNRMSRGALLLLVGDPFQIPAISPGAMLRDLVRAGGTLGAAGCPVHELKEVIRSEGALAVNTVQILDSKLERKPSPDWHINLDVEPEQAVIRDMELLSREENVDMRDMVVLSPVRKGRSGVNSMNWVLQDYWRGRRAQDIEPREYESNKFGPRPLEGDRLVWLKNDVQNTGLMNGTMGTHGGQLTGDVYYEEVGHGALKPGKWMRFIKDDGKKVYVPEADWDLMTVAYCMTVHKAQGSEWRYVFVVIPDHAAVVMADRALLYTAMSRAKIAVYLYGRTPSVKTYLRATKSDERLTVGVETLVNSPSLDVPAK